MLQSSSKQTCQHQLFRGDCLKSGLHGQIAAKKPPLKDTNKKRRAWAKKHEQWTLDWWKYVLEFKAHFTSMATTAFCSETPSHLVCA